MYEGINVQRTLFQRLFNVTKDILEQQGGYLGPLAHIFWQDGHSSSIDMEEDDFLNTFKVAEFLKDLDHYCAEHGVYFIYVCVPLPQVKHSYICVMVGKEWGMGGIIRGIKLDKGVALDSEHDLSKFDEFFKEYRMKVLLESEAHGRC